MVSRKTVAELKQLGLEKWRCFGCGRIEFRHPELQRADLDGKRRFCGVNCFHLHAAKERAAHEELVKTCECGVKFRCTPSQDWVRCESCRIKNKGPIKKRVDVECPDCGKIRQYTTSASNKLRTNKCLVCTRKERSSSNVTVICPDCGKKRTMGKYAASKKKTGRCFDCWHAKRTEHAKTDFVTIVCPECQQSREIRTNYRGKTDYCETCSKKRYHPPKNRSVLKPCKICGTETRNQKYCSVQCRHQGLTKIVDKNCEQCGVSFKCHFCRIDSNKYCSMACKHEAAKKRIKFTCPVCSTTIEMLQSTANRRMTCSNKCGFIYRTTKAAKKCPICRKNNINSRKIICGKCNLRGGKNIAVWKKAAKRAMVAHGNGKWRYAQKTKVTKEIALIINEHFDDYNLLSMPHIGRELVMLQQLTQLNMKKSLGIEREKSAFIALQAIINRYFDGTMPLVYNDVDKFCIKTKRRFDVAHLDYNGPLTQNHLDAINQLIASDTLTFFTVAQNHRFKDHINDVIYYSEDPPVIGHQILKIPYIGSSKVPMETFGYIK